MKLRVSLIVFIVCLSTVFFSCRRNRPSLVDANRPPETELWYAPPDSTEYDYLVHLYWRGIDPDGIAVRYIWTITDTLVEGPLRWNPSERVADLRAGHVTTRTDSVFSFTAFRNVGGVGLKKNRQAFHVASVDDNGVIDPSPAAIEFVATVDQLPRVRFTTTVTRIIAGVRTDVTKPYNPAEIDTVGMLRPFRITYNAVTSNGLIRAFQFFPLTADVNLAGANVWSTDLGDTTRVFANVDADALPSGRFRLAVQARDDAGAESTVDAGRFTEGVVQIVVNFEPQTEIFDIVNTNFVGGSAVTDTVSFRDGIPDTLPFNSWMTIFFEGRDNPSDSSLCQDVVNKCLSYQMQYTRIGEVDGGPAVGGSTNLTKVGWQPLDPEDSNAFGTSDSTSMNVGSQTYLIRARAVDEFGKPDGTPPEVRIMGNLRPTLDTFGIVNYDGNVASNGDTLRWDWWNPSNYNGSVTDTLKFVGGGIEVLKEFYFIVSAGGHDDPREGNISAIKSWLYDFERVDTQQPQKFVRSGFWSDTDTPNALSDTFKVVFRYDFIADPGGVQSFAQRADFYDKSYDVTVRGRDAAEAEEFEQFMFLNGDKQRINVYNTSRLGRFTTEGGLRFYFTLER